MERFKHIAVIGTAAQGALGLSVRAAFEGLGKRVTYVPYVDWLHAVAGRWKLRGAGVIYRATSPLTRPLAEARLVATLSRAKPDLVVLVKCDDLHATTYAALRRLVKAPIVAFHPDDPWNVDTRARRGPAHRRAALQVREVDLICLWSHALVARARAEGAKHAAYLPFACDPAAYPYVDPASLSAEERARYHGEVVFIGNWDTTRERWLAAIVEAGLPLTIWGADYWAWRARHRGLRAAYKGRPLFGDEQSKAIAAGAIHLNVLRDQNKGATNMRTFDIPCMGGFLLHERSPEAAAFFPVGEAMADFATPDELVAAIRKWLADPEGRRRVAAEGHRRALAWTYRQWCEALMAAVPVVT